MLWTWLSLNLAAVAGLIWLRQVPYLSIKGHTVFFPVRLFHAIVVPFIVVIGVTVLIRLWVERRQARSVLASPILWMTCLLPLAILETDRGYPVAFRNTISGATIPFDHSCDASETLVQQGEPNGGLLLLMEQIHLPSTTNPPFELRQAVGIHQACIGIELARRNIRIIVLEDLTLDWRSFGVLYEYEPPLFPKGIPSRLADFRTAQLLEMSKSGVLAYRRSKNGVAVHPAGGEQAWNRFQNILQLARQLGEKERSATERVRLEAEQERLIFAEREEDAAEQVALWWRTDQEESTLALVYGAAHHFPATLFQKDFEKKPTVMRISWMNSPAMIGYRLYLEHDPEKELSIIRGAVAIPYADLEQIDSVEGRLQALPKVLPAPETFPAKQMFESELRRSATKGLEKLVPQSALSEAFEQVSRFVSRQAERLDGPFAPYEYKNLSDAEARGEVSSEAIIGETNPVRQLKLIETARKVDYNAFIYVATREGQRAALQKLRIAGQLEKPNSRAILSAQAFDQSIKNLVFELAQANKGPFISYR